MTNAWAGTVSGERGFVCAGWAQTSTDGSAGNGQQEAVVAADSAANTTHTYLSSGLDGAPTIEGARGTILTLSATDGRSYSFELLTNTLTKTG